MVEEGWNKGGDMAVVSHKGAGEQQRRQHHQSQGRLTAECWGPTELSYLTILLLLPQGIQYLIEQQVLSSDLQEIAKFLHKGEGLNKTAIGDYLGGR